MMQRIILLTAALGLILSGGAVLPVPAATPSPMPNPAVRYDRGRLIIAQGSKKVTLNVEIARTMEARSQGLMLRKSLPEDAGMLFVFEEAAKWGFWMRNTLIPLSLGIIDKNWQLLEILDMKVADDPLNGPWPTYEPSAAYRYALEVNQGFFQRKGITPGARLELIILK